MLKLALYVVVAYLLFRAIANLVRAMVQQKGVGTGTSGAVGSSGRETSRNGRRTESERATRLRDEEDVEDATWEDL